MSSTSFEQRKIKLLQELPLNNPDEFYEKLIFMGKHLATLDLSLCTEDNRVKGCQSRMYIHTTYQDEKLFFKAKCDALISAGLAAVTIFLFSDLKPQEILQADLSFIQDLGFESSVSSSRLNGLSSLIQRVKQDALVICMHASK